MTDMPIPDHIARVEVVAAGDVDGVLWVTARMAQTAPSMVGYVRLPAGHPWRELDYDEIHDQSNVDVHGGLTFSDGEWIGFDTAHAFDRWPVTADTPEWRRSLFNGPDREYAIHWTPEKVADEARHLAEQVAAVMARP